MKNFELDARKVRAAMFTQAKNDVRYYLNGLLIGGGRIVSTDGHRMTIIGEDVASEEPKIYQIKGSILKSARTCEFVFVGDDHGFLTMKNNLGVDLDKVLKFCIVDGRYPDYERVMPIPGTEKTVSEIGFNVKYLADVDKVAEALGSKFTVGAFRFYESKTAQVTIKTAECEAVCLIMEARL